MTEDAKRYLIGAGMVVAVFAVCAILFPWFW